MPGSSTKRLILQISPSASTLSWLPSIIGVRKRDGMLGTDIFCKLGLLTAAAALPGETAFITVMGLIPAPRGLRLGDVNEDSGKGSYYPGPGA